MSVQNATKSNYAANYAAVNGIELYYETYGVGEPLILLHGGFGTTEMFGEVRSRLAEGRQVIAVELQAHGHTADIDRPLRYEFMADDIAALIKLLGFERADIMGFSLGGGVALQTAIRHPEVVRRLVLVSSVFASDGWYPEMLEGMRQMGAGSAEWMKQTPIYPMYTAIAPRPEDWLTLHMKMGEMLSHPYDWSEQVKAITAPVMIVAGDADGLRPAHSVQFFELLGGGQRDGGWDGSGISNPRLAILPGLTHYNINLSPALAETVIAYLDA